jgi:CO/xanthine dehydrogenase FAD-binding subunit
VTVWLPTSIDEAISALADSDVQVLAGGTDFLVEVNAGHRRPDAVVALGRIPELKEWQPIDGGVRLGAGVTYTQMLQPDLAALLPALAHAARTVGSPPIRNAGTIGGNLGTASPAGDTLPVLAALDAVVEVAGRDGVRNVAIEDFVTGPKRNALGPGEVVTAVRVPLLRGPQEYRKVGVRNAMVIAVASLALAVDIEGRTVRCALGSVGPVPLRARNAESWLAEQVDWDRLTVADPAAFDHFGALVAEAARPIDDHRSTAEYRRHAVGVLAGRTAAQAFGAPAGAAA